MKSTSQNPTIIRSCQFAVAAQLGLLALAPVICVQADGAVPAAPASAIVELMNGDTFNLTAAMVTRTIAGHEVKMMAYNGTIPGPTLKVTIHFTNQTDIPTTLHSHGVRLDNRFDGVPGTTQKLVGKGESFDYKIKFPDVGLFWYHPHAREDATQPLGLYGNYLVEPAAPDYWAPVNREVPLMVGDLLMDNGELVPSGPVADHALMGRFGNVMLANGSDQYTLAVKQGEVIRLYLTNVASVRVFDLAIPGVKMKRVGADNGRYERETWVDHILLAPSERAIVDVLFDAAGDFPLLHVTPQHTYALGTIKVAPGQPDVSFAAQFQTLRVNREVTVAFDQFRPDFERTADKSLVLTMTMDGMSGGSMNMGGMRMGGMNMGGGADTDKIEWEDTMAMMNAMATSGNIHWKITDATTGKSGMDLDWHFKVGDRVKVRIFNDPASMHAMQHPIHFHGQRFLVLDTNGVKNDNLVWKDTTLIQKGDTVDLLVDMEDPGTWMAHCHIPEHLESGMMFEFQVD